MPRLTTRDYKKSSRRSPDGGRFKEFGIGVIVGAILASGAFLLAGAHARHHAATTPRAHRVQDGDDSSATPPRAPAADAGATPDTSPASSQQAASAQAAPPAVQYDFYKMLPSFKVPVPRDDERPSSPPPAASRETTGPAAGAVARAAPAYILQIGSYRSATEAGAVRSRLARAGIDSQIQRIAAGATTWNRVRVGPLTDAELAKVRERLGAAKIPALVIRVDQ